MSIMPAEMKKATQYINKGWVRNGPALILDDCYSIQISP
jgi:hypothetical protein